LATLVFNFTSVSPPSKRLSEYFYAITKSAVCLFLKYLMTKAITIRTIATKTPTIMYTQL